MLTGQGTTFCAWRGPERNAFAAGLPTRLIELHKAMDASPMPVVGASNGPAIGAGLQLAMHQCDLRVVAPDAFFQFPSKYGLALDNWASAGMSSLVGHGRAARLLQRGKADAESLHTRNGESHWHFGRRPGRAGSLAIQHAKRVLNDDGAIERGRPIRNSSTKPGAARDVISAGCPDGKAAAEVPRA